jgi:NADPH-dependent 2,4-dienoyl-CoA reductase/sulfur reductase-like enzyme
MAAVGDAVELTDGTAIPFDACVLATGARPRRLFDGPLTLRSLGDARELAKLQGSATVIGSGFIGCEAAASMAIRGADVTVAALESRPQVERLGAEASERIAGWLRGYGVTIIGEAELAALAGGPGRLTASFADGRELRADAVLLALGIVRNDELAAAAGVETDDGVLVDDSMVSSDPRLLAAGDVARAANAAAGRRLAVEHWGEAIKHGEVAGATLAGVEAHWGSAPGFWSTIGERTLKFAGWGQGWDELRFESHGDDFTAWYGHEGELAGVLTHQRDHDYALGREAIERRTGWS